MYDFTLEKTDDEDILAGVGGCSGTGCSVGCVAGCAGACSCTGGAAFWAPLGVGEMGGGAVVEFCNV
jgi:hypothetical protein